MDEKDGRAAEIAQMAKQVREVADRMENEVRDKEERVQSLQQKLSIAETRHADELAALESKLVLAQNAADSKAHQTEEVYRKKVANLESVLDDTYRELNQLKSS